MSLLTERVVLDTAIEAGELQWVSATARRAVARAAEYAVEDTSTVVVSGGRPSLIEPLIKGALHGALVGVVLALLSV